MTEHITLHAVRYKLQRSYEDSSQKGFIFCALHIYHAVMDFIVDVLGFRDSAAKFMIKEVAVVSLNNEYIAHWISSAPHSFSDLPIKTQVHNNWITSNIHGIEWFEGDIPYRQLHANLRELARTARQIFVRGVEEAHLIQNITTRHVENLESFNCPSTYNLPKRDIFCCYHGALHKGLYKCALNNAYRLKSWVNKNLALLDALDAKYGYIDPRQGYRSTADRTVTSSAGVHVVVASEVQDLSKQKTKKIKYVRPATPGRTSQEHTYDVVSDSDYYTSPVSAEKTRGTYIQQQQQDEHKSNTGCSTTAKNTFNGCFPCRPNPTDIDETDGMCI